MAVDLLTFAVLGVVFASTLTQSTLGFGNALLAMPLLSLMVGLDIARPLVALNAVTVAAGVVVRDWRNIRIWQDRQLLFGSLVGIPLGFWSAERAPEAWVKAVLALVLIGFAWFRLRTPEVRPLESTRSAGLFGFAAGVLGGAYNTYGPPLVVYATLRQWEQQRFRATMQGLFVPIGLLILLIHWRTGAWTADVQRYYLLGLPGLLVALWLGRVIAHALPVQRFYAVVYWLLIVLGVSLLVQVGWRTIDGQSDKTVASASRGTYDEGSSQKGKPSWLPTPAPASEEYPNATEATHPPTWLPAAGGLQLDHRRRVEGRRQGPRLRTGRQ